MGGVEALPWESAAFAPLEPSEAVLRLLERLRTTHTNGEVLFGSFLVRADRFCSALNQHGNSLTLGLSGFTSRWWYAPAVRSVFHRLGLPAEPESGPVYHDSDHLALTEELARLAFVGGAYWSPERDPHTTWRTALRLGMDVVEDLAPGAGSILVHHGPWCDWFWGVAWDHTYLVVDRERSRVSALLVSDTD